MRSQPWRSEKVRRTREEVQPFINDLLAWSETLYDYDLVDTYICGSWRREAPDVGDLDILVVTESGTFKDFQFPTGFIPQHSGDQIVQGDLFIGLNHNTEDLVEMFARAKGIHADFYACTREQRGAMLMFLTGPKALNINQRAWALKLGFTLSQYGLFAHDGKQIDGGTEQDIYQRLGLEYLTPEARQAYAEIKAPTDAPEMTVMVQSDSDRSTQYKVTIKTLVDPTQTKIRHIYTCSCLGFNYSRKSPRTCKHIMRVQTAHARLRQRRAANEQ
jgi:hypothetical protein